MQGVVPGLCFYRSDNMRTIFIGLRFFSWIISQINLIILFLFFDMHKIIASVPFFLFFF